MSGEEPKLTLNLISENPVQSGEESTHQKRKLSESDDPVTENDSPKGKSKRKKLESGEHKATKKKDPASDFVSSLFNHNPEIPRLDLSEPVEPVHESVFSEGASSGFDKLVHPYLVQNLKQNCNISRMTSVQVKAVPVILGGKDALIKSQTGSGKTLAYALPIVHQMQAFRPEITRDQGVFALVIVPTRELALQSLELFEKLCKSFARIVPGILCGGEKKKSEKARLRKGINILVATPGRLLDHIQHTKSLNLQNIRFLVFDEADRMLELGYERDVRAILDALNQQCQHVRQTLLLSATLTKGIEQLSEVSMKHPKFVDAAVKDEDADGDQSLKSMTTPENLKQAFIITPAKLRLVTLASFILWKCRYSKARKMLIFMSTQDMIDFHSDLFNRCLNHLGMDDKDEFKGLGLTDDAKEILKEAESRKGDRVKGIQSHSIPIEFLKLHGNMTQKDRTEVFSNFRQADSGVLLCTDVAARGLDLPKVDWIVQYNAPVSREDYVHRVGRTARIGTKGSSLIFLLPNEANFVRELEKERLLLAEMTIEQVLQKLHKNAEPNPRNGRIPSSPEEAATNIQMHMETIVAGDEDVHKIASQAYVSFIRSYASYPKEVRDIFCFKELHLGHIAKSFALRDPPSKITGIGKGQWVRNDERKRMQRNQEKKEERMIKAQKKRINQKALIMSEFDSGLSGIELKPLNKVNKKRITGRNNVRHPKGK